MVVFDLDGTLLNTLRDINSALNYGLSLYSIQPLSLKETRSLIGRGLRNATESAVQKSGVIIEDEEIDLMYEMIISYYNNHPSIYSSFYPEIEELLKRIEDNGMKMAILSNKKDEIVQKIVKEKLSSFTFSFVMGQTNRFPLKPNPSSLFYMIEKEKLKKEDILYIGDSEVDYTLSKNANVDSIIVSYGFRSREELKNSGVETIVDTTLEIEKILFS